MKTTKRILAVAMALVLGLALFAPVAMANDGDDLDAPVIEEQQKEPTLLERLWAQFEPVTGEMSLQEFFGQFEWWQIVMAVPVILFLLPGMAIFGLGWVGPLLPLLAALGIASWLGDLFGFSI